MNDPDILKGVGGCFGLAGIVTAITFKMDETMYPNCNPKKTLTMADPESEAFKEIVDWCEDYYVQFFWFPNNGNEGGYWENCWKKT